jgi:hypothetical protein
VIWYRTELGLVRVEHWLEELEDLHDKIEFGPHWDTVTKIEVFRVNHCECPSLTIERAMAL